MKRVLSVLALAAASSLAVPALARSRGIDTTRFQARATGTAEWWPNDSPGTAVATVDLEGYDLLVDMPFSGLVGTTIDAHIHCCTSAPGSGAAPVALPLVGLPIGVRDGNYSATLQLAENWTYDPAFLESTGGTAKGGFLTMVRALDAGTAYVDIHTGEFPNGEIRGFLVAPPVPEPAEWALLAGGLASLWGIGRNRRR
ncbi:CHRD domain-containing protein [Massilia sp.]|uniref:CHRD domain-containing protein n=1 Tax=Massilia sp. TaxID=1882437 RepID=UPI00352E7450